jgi:hypothetical protein
MSGEVTRLDPVEITAIPPAACAATVWRSKGQLRLTVIAKATFLFTPGDVMSLAHAEPIVRAELHHKNSPTQSVRATSECAPYLPRCDVLLTGNACALGGEQVTGLAVRLAVCRDQDILDKTIHVYGDRKAAGADPAPFRMIPIVYERAYGGLGVPNNPLGTGLGGEGNPPNLIDPVDPAVPACFGPISRTWPIRKRLLGKTDRKTLDQPIAEIPPEFDWNYFQSAPPDQQIDYLRGDEWVVLEGLHPEHAGVQSRLPGARALARVYGLADGGEGHRITLVADTLSIDADDLFCSVVWRSSFALPNEAALAALHIDVGVEVAGMPLDWPVYALPPPPAAPPPPMPPSKRVPDAPSSRPSGQWGGAVTETEELRDLRAKAVAPGAARIPSAAMAGGAAPPSKAPLAKDGGWTGSDPGSDDGERSATLRLKAPIAATPASDHDGAAQAEAPPPPPALRGRQSTFVMAPGSAMHLPPPGDRVTDDTEGAFGGTIQMNVAAVAGAMQFAPPPPPVPPQDIDPSPADPDDEEEVELETIPPAAPAPGAVAAREAMMPEELVERRLHAYNARDVDGLLAAHADDCVVEDGEGEVLMRGREEMRAFYGALFARSPDLCCEVRGRVCVGSYVFDEERVTGGSTSEIHAMVAYRVVEGLIRHVRTFQ